jgi:hypothetical protein
MTLQKRMITMKQKTGDGLPNNKPKTKRQCRILKHKLENGSINDLKWIINDLILYILGKRQEMGSIEWYKHKKRGHGQGHDRHETLQTYSNPQYKA